jgi:threonine dehydrogenase-like Zn-dependent dehydrogenase
MRAAIFEGEGRVNITSKPDPSIVNSDDVIIGVAGNGICGSDIGALAVPPRIKYTVGIVIGHETVGTVVEVGPTSDLKPGDRVVVHPNIYCGRCWYCQTGQRNLCGDQQIVGENIDGGTAEFLLVPTDRAYKLPDELPFDRAILAEPLGCVLNGTHKARIHPGESLVLFGAGPIGSLYFMTLKARGAYPVIVAEPAEHRRKAALELGADVVIDPTSEDVQEKVMEATGGLGADVVIDTVGSLAPLGIEIIRKGGRVLIFGVNLTARETSFIRVVAKEAKIEGILDAADHLALAIRLLTQNRIPYGRLVTSRFGLDDFDRAVDGARHGEILKPVVVIDDAAIGLGDPGQPAATVGA